MLATEIKQSFSGSGEEYDNLLKAFQQRFDKLDKEPLFTTDIAGMFDVYLANFPEAERQFHNCHNCRHFIERFGGLVTINDDGLTGSVFWNCEDLKADSQYRPGFEALHRLVRRAKVTGVFFSSDESWGNAETLDKKRECVWTHFSVKQKNVFHHAVKDAGQAMAKKLEDFKNVQRALSEFTVQDLNQAIMILNSDALYRSEKVIGPAKWLYELQMAVLHGQRENLVWKAVSMAPAGFCHPRSSMIGTLLEDIQSGMQFNEVSRRFKDKMHPLQYQRPQAAPTAGNIAAAEKLVEKLGIARSLERRFARIDEIVAVWKLTVDETKKENVGVFGHLIPKGEDLSNQMKIPAQIMTWVKFESTVLSLAKKIELFIPNHGNFCALMTASHMDAPPILQWDSPDRRNPVSHYIYHNGSPASQWGLSGNQYHKVNAVTLYPNQWQEGFDHHSKGVLFILDGAVDSSPENNAIFPETLKSELHEVRATIEAY